MYLCVWIKHKNKQTSLLEWLVSFTGPSRYFHFFLSCLQCYARLNHILAMTNMNGIRFLTSSVTDSKKNSTGRLTPEKKGSCYVLSDYEGKSEAFMVVLTKEVKSRPSWRVERHHLNIGATAHMSTYFLQNYGLFIECCQD